MGSIQPYWRPCWLCCFGQGYFKQPLSQPINQAFSQQGPFHFQEGTQEDQEGPCLKKCFQDKEGFQEQEPQSPSCEEGSEGSLHGSQGYHYTHTLRTQVLRRSAARARRAAVIQDTVGCPGGLPRPPKLHHKMSCPCTS